MFSKHEPLSVAYGIGIPEHNTEGRAITPKFEEYYMLCVYTPNAKRELTRLNYRKTRTLGRGRTHCAITFCGRMRKSP